VAPAVILLPLLVGVVGDPVRPAFLNVRGMGGWRNVPVRIARAEGAKAQQQACHKDSRCDDIQEKWSLGGTMAARALPKITTWHRSYSARSPAELQPP
jgi:hypothetical protein